MIKKNEKESKDDWFKKLDLPFKSINNQYKKLFLKNKDISKNQKILNEYNIRNQNNKISKLKKNLMPLNEKALLRRINIYNYKYIDRENNIMKNILSKIQERKNNRNKSIPPYLKLRRLETNIEIEKYSSQKNNKSINQHINRLNLQKINYYSMNNPSITDRNKKEKPLKLILHKKLNLNLNNDNINSEKIILSSVKKNKKNYLYKNIFTNENENQNDEENEFDKNFFKTITRIDKYKSNNNKKMPNRIDNLCEMMKIIRDEEDYGKKLNSNILFIKKSQKILNSNNKSRKINLSLNFTKNRNRRLNDNLKIKKFYFLDNLKNNSQTSSEPINNNDEGNINNIKGKNSLKFPICPPQKKI